MFARNFDTHKRLVKTATQSHDLDFLHRQDARLFANAASRLHLCMRGSKLIIENLPLKNSKGCFFEESVQQPFDNCLSSCLAIGSGLAFSICIFSIAS